MGALTSKMIYIYIYICDYLWTIIGHVQLFEDNKPKVSVKLLPPLFYCTTILGKNQWVIVQVIKYRGSICLIQAPVVRHLESSGVLISWLSYPRIKTFRKELLYKGYNFHNQVLFVIFMYYIPKGEKDLILFPLTILVVP